MNERRDTSNRYTFNFDDIESSKCPKITKLVVSQFTPEPASELTLGLDEQFQDYKNANCLVGLEWDI